jgi:hypothetical protein
MVSTYDEEAVAVSVIKKDVDSGTSFLAANPSVSAAERSDSDYYVSGEGLPCNWMDVLSHKGYNI